MADIKITIVEGIDQFHAEGDSETVQRLITEWRARVDLLRASAQSEIEHAAMTPRGPLGAGVFPRRTN